MGKDNIGNMPSIKADVIEALKNSSVPLTPAKVMKAIKCPSRGRVCSQLRELLRKGIVVKKGWTYKIPK